MATLLLNKKYIEKRPQTEKNINRNSCCFLNKKEKHFNQYIEILGNFESKLYNIYLIIKEIEGNQFNSKLKRKLKKN